MKYNPEYSPLAMRDLDRIWHEVFEASKNYDICENYINDLLDKIENKAKYPKSATPLYYEDLFTGYYYIRFKDYLAFYRIEGDKLLVDRVLFAASDYRRTLRLSSE